MQKYENLDGDQAKRFYLQYTFPPFSVGEVGRNGAPGRREVGHGNLAERSLVAALPDQDDFSYSMRVESLITESCGSSSMASVCGGSLAMMAAGVPLKHAVAGVAMGMLLDEEGGGEPPIILTDILGSEDALGTMDFKVAGNEAGISTFQLDIKCEGLSIELMREALEQARDPRNSGALRRNSARNSAQFGATRGSDGPRRPPLEQARDARLHILGLMKAAMPAHAASLPPAVPRMRKMRIDPTKVGRVIGTGGATIKALIEETGVANIAIDKSAEPGEIVITGFDDDAIADAQARIDAIAGGDGPPGGRRRRRAEAGGAAAAADRGGRGVRGGGGEERRAVRHLRRAVRRSRRLLPHLAAVGGVRLEDGGRRRRRRRQDRRDRGRPSTTRRRASTASPSPRPSRSRRAAAAAAAVRRGIGG